MDTQCLGKRTRHIEQHNPTQWNCDKYKLGNFQVAVGRHKLDHQNKLQEKQPEALIVHSHHTLNMRRHCLGASRYLDSSRLHSL